MKFQIFSKKVADAASKIQKYEAALTALSGILNTV